MSLVLVLRYAGFALVASAANLGAQRLAAAAYGGPFALLAALVAGTGVGLVVKYLLDKRWVFEDRSGGIEAHARRFSLYTLTGAGTTALFWGVEAAADALFGADWRLVGGAAGLAAGYVIKYRLDRRFVFAGRAA